MGKIDKVRLSAEHVALHILHNDCDKNHNDS